jgi:hypothetical protein
MLAAMAYCPGCGNVIAKDAVNCPRCHLTFGDEAAGQPLDAPPPPAHVALQAPPWLHIATRTSLALLSVAFLALSAWVAHAARNGAPWRNACIVAMVVVVLVAAQARTRWSFAVLFAAVALGMTTCSNTFHWGGG